MQCPYFKKVNFQKIEQRTDQEDQIEKNLNISDFKRLSTKDQESLEDSIPQQGCTNDIKVQKYRRVLRYDSVKSTNSQQVEQSDKIITIKMPKTLEIKEFNIEKKQENIKLNKFSPTINKQNYSSNGHPHKVQNTHQIPKLQQIEEQVSESSSQQPKFKQAKVFQINKNMFLQSTFYSIVILPSTGQQYFCHLDETVLKIVSIPNIFNNKQEKCKSMAKIQATSTQIKQHTSTSYKFPDSKIKYFVDLKKYKLEINSISPNTVSLTMLCKGQKQTIQIQFLTQNERCTFECVYMSILQTISTNNRQYSMKVSKKSFNYQPKQILNSQSQKDNQQEISQISVNMLKSQKSIDSLKFSVQRMKYKQVIGLINTFDIILFKGKNIMSKVQRFFTNSGFDHVGLIMKTTAGSLLLLQATGNVGVAMYSFSSIQMALRKNFYERIAIRKFSQINKLTVSQRNKKLAALQEFVLQTNGKKYKFNPMYLVSSSINKVKRSETTIENTNQQQTYFCSQLVAQALKVCGILKKIRPSYKYLPKHFSDIDGLNSEIQDGFYYSDPIILQK